MRCAEARPPRCRRSASSASAGEHSMDCRHERPVGAGARCGRRASRRPRRATPAHTLAAPRGSTPPGVDPSDEEHEAAESEGRGPTTGAAGGAGVRRSASIEQRHPQRQRGDEQGRDPRRMRCSAFTTPPLPPSRSAAPMIAVRAPLRRPEPGAPRSGRRAAPTGAKSTAAGDEEARRRHQEGRQGLDHPDAHAGNPKTMQVNPYYENIVSEVFEFLRERRDELVSRGIDQARIAIDPGYGFGKRAQDNVQLVQCLSRFAELGQPIVVGISRKSVIAQLLCNPKLPPEERLWPTVALTSLLRERAHTFSECMTFDRTWRHCG